MLKRYGKSDAPAWDRKLTAVFGFLIGITLLLFVALALTLYLDRDGVDACLDNGGSYDYEQARCDFEVSQPGPE